ncbi:vacuolar sorting protein 9 domain-containing protein [Cavenderia fasciculata]|uniref:Vacuolar sorting protein 9 domain-containing protein n=1 Tax=Cavenderia fasciculata TaxID=261658 RepID=F4PPR0_CACFS|nr:vacuolar sorting protein 9 domain-containing protein [Cavenderia fasciculata]EGG22373.1 vacuolar sorting protein 9 domain-containing protein [Cavenderia fasciculata]|eukprot:XP_004360224.1 vacuolar sorting protein 9 domain-containing protein [Cavenderia fasciculata]
MIDNNNNTNNTNNTTHKDEIKEEEEEDTITITTTMNSTEQEIEEKEKEKEEQDTNKENKDGDNNESLKEEEEKKQDDSSTTISDTTGTNENTTTTTTQIPTMIQSPPIIGSPSTNTTPGSFKTNLGNFLSNYYVNPKQPAISLYSGIKNSITMIKDNLPSPPSLVSNSFNTLTNLPLISFVQNNIPFPISYSGKPTTTTTTSSSVNTTTTSTTTSTSTITPTTSSYHPLKNENVELYFNEINKRLESSDHSHLVITIDSFVDSINTQIMNLHSSPQSTDDNNIDTPKVDLNSSAVVPMINSEVIQGFSEDICQSIKSFMSTALPMLLNSVAGIPFQSGVVPPPKGQSTTPCIPSLSSMTPLDREIVAYEYLEQTITSKIYRRFFSYPPNIEMDTRLCEHISTFQFITPANLDIDPDQFINPNNLQQQQSFEQIQEQLLRMTSCKSPRDKLTCIKKSFNSIFKLLSFDNQNNNNGNNNNNNNNGKSSSTPSTPKIIGADLLLPIVIYVLIKSNLPFLLSNIEFISLFREPTLIESEVSYYFVTLVTAATFIQNMTMESLTIIHPNPTTKSPTTTTEQSPSLVPTTTSTKKDGQDKERQTKLDSNNQQDKIMEIKKDDEKDKKIIPSTTTTTTTPSKPPLPQQQQQPLSPRSQQDEIKSKQKQWKYYKKTAEELSIKDIKQLMTDFNQLVDFWYDNNNSHQDDNPPQ